MAKTLTGIVQLILKDGASGQAKKVEQSLNSVRRTAMGLGASAAGADRLNAALNRMGSAPWGASLQARLEKLKLLPHEFDKVRASWDKLQASLSGGVNPRLDTRMIANWRTGVISHFAAVQASANTTKAKLSDLAKAGFTAAGLGTGAYVTGRLARAGIASDASIERERFRARASGFTPEQLLELETSSMGLASKYGMGKADVMEVQREAILGISDDKTRSSFEKVRALRDDILRFNATMGNIHGNEAAGDFTRAMMRTFDILGINEPEKMRQAMDTFARMNRVIGKDTNPGQLFLAAKYARAAGKALDPEFFFGLMPAMMAESSGSDIGTQNRAAFDAVVGGRMSRKAQSAFARLGLLNDDGSVKDSELMANPIMWVEGVLKPALERAGIDTNDNLKVGQQLSQMFDNRLTSNFMSNIISQIDQYRNTRDKARKAHGLDDAEQIRAGDPFKAYEAFQKALGNLSGALGISSALATGLNKISDLANTAASGVSSLAAALREAGPTGQALATIGAVFVGGGLAYATVKAAATGLGLVAGAVGVLANAGGAAGLATTALGLGAVATALSSMASVLVPGGALIGGLAAISAVFKGLDDKLRKDIASGDPSADKFLENQARKDGFRLDRQRQFGADYVAAGGKLSDLMLNRIQSGDDVRVYQRQRTVETGSIFEAGQAAQQLGQQIQSLNVMASPQVDVSGFRAAIAEAQRLLGLVQEINRASSRVGSGVGSAYSDFGVAP